MFERPDRHYNPWAARAALGDVRQVADALRRATAPGTELRDWAARLDAALDRLAPRLPLPVDLGGPLDDVHDGPPDEGPALALDPRD